MSYWKLGCRWGSKKDGLPLFLELLIKHNIVISWIDKDFGINSKIILTDGHTIIGIAETTSSGISSSKFPELKEEFEKYKIHFHPDLLIYKSKIFTIDLKDRFEYKLVQGICGINDPQIISQTNKLYKKYLKKMETENFKSLLEYKKQIILQGPPGTGKTKLAKEIAQNMIGLGKNKKSKPSEITKNEITQFLKLGQVIPSVKDKSVYTILSISSNNVKLQLTNLSEYSPSFAEIIKWYYDKKWNKGEQIGGTDPYSAALAKYIYDVIPEITDTDINADSDQYKLIQFHPSYTYEDFVRGIVAKPNPEGEGIIYEAENKTLGQFAKLALDNYLASQGIQNTNSDFENRLKVLLEEINNKIDSGETYKFADKSTAEIISVGSNYLIYSFPNRLDIRYKLLFSDIEKIFNKKNDIKIPIDLRDKEKELQLEMKGKYPYYFMILEKLNKISNLPSLHNKVEELKNYILIIDEINRGNLSSVLGELIYALEYRGEKVESIYDIKGEGNQLILPPNLFIIGTMNTSDRSVGHIDYAIRRRFAFIDVLPKVLEMENFQVEAFKTISTLFIKNLDAYLLDNNVVLVKSEHLSEEFNPKDVWLGHSYFISKDDEFDIRKKYEIKPILEEYVKDGILKKSAESIINGL